VPRGAERIGPPSHEPFDAHSRCASEPEALARVSWVMHPPHAMRRNALALLLALALSLAASSVSAALIPHTDLASTAYEASDIVRATWRSSRTEQWVRLGTYRVERVFAGTLTVGATIEVADGNVSATDTTPLPADRYLALAPAVVGEPRRLATSGMRAVLDGHVWRFEQLSNPGLEVPLPQGDTLSDGRGDTAVDRVGVTPARFEAMLADAMARANALRALRAHWSAEAPARMEALLLPAPSRRTDGGYHDTFTLAVVTTLVEHQRFDEALALVARNDDDHLAWDLERALPVTELAPRARGNAQRAVRRAAVRLLRAACIESDVAADTLVALLADPDALVREAAARNLAQVFGALVSGEGAAAFVARKTRVERALLARLRVEADAAVRLAIATTFNANGNSVRTLPTPAGGPPLVLRAEATGDGVHVEAVCARPDAHGDRAGLELVTASGAVVQGYTSYAYACGGARTGMNSGALNSGLAVGRYGIRLRMGRRVWPLGTLVIAPDGSRRVE
jgi:hypothetical protein